MCAISGIHGDSSLSQHFREPGWPAYSQDVTHARSGRFATHRSCKYSGDRSFGQEVEFSPAVAKTESRDVTKPPKLYTSSQAAAGETAYRRNCAKCHGFRMNGPSEGYSAPALRGLAFADPEYGFSISDIFKIITRRMPASAPGSLSDDLNVALMAFILKRNGYPAGSGALTYTQAATSRIPMQFYR
jgi:hypothetical protein